MDDDAIARVIRENPALATDALASLEESLADGLETTTGARGVVTGAREFLSAQHGYPVVWTEPRATVVDDVTSQSLDATVDRLLARIVRPKRRSGGPRRPNPTETIEKTVQSLIAKRVVTRKHYFEKSLSGIPRGVDFFVNSTANLALDVVNLSVQSADEILKRADAEAFKVQDVTSEPGRPLSRMHAADEG